MTPAARLQASIELSEAIAADRRPADAVVSEWLRDAGVDPVPTREEMLTAYRTGPAWGFCMWAATPDQLYSTEVVAAMLGRFAEAYSDLGTGELLRE